MTRAEARRGGEVSATMRKNLLALTDAYVKAKKTTQARVSKQLYGRSDFLKELRRGRQSPSLVKVDQVVDFFRTNWPEDVPWPFLDAVVIRRRDP
jgi:hypothetical protein